MDMQFEEFKKTFFQECDELLADLEYQLSLLKNGSLDAEPVHAAFRAVHSIKGGAGMFGFTRLVRFAHEFENALRLMRSGSVELSSGTIDAAIQAGDIIADLVEAARNGTEIDQAHETEAADRLANAVGGEVRAIAAPEVYAASLKTEVIAPAGVSSSAMGAHRFVYAIAFKPARHLFQRMNEPLLIIDQLRGLGHLDVVADISDLPLFADLGPTDAYLAWKMRLETHAARATVEEAFEYVEDDCELTIACLEDRGDATAPGTEEDPPSERLAFAEPSYPASGAGRAHGLASIRVDLDRIDRLVNMVGEIAVSQTMVYQHIDRALTVSNPQLFTELSQLLKLTQSLQDSVMAIRAQPIRTIFARMPRLLRDLVGQTGKDVRLETFGEETEIDKTLVEQLVDPLTHMLRNAVDHGIEAPTERIARGKPQIGTIRISAAQRGSQIVIEVADDGRGIDPAKVRRRAVEQQLISADAVLTEDEIHNLVFLPGFSTAEKVSELSGRGVGMDVVKRNIQKIGGRVSLVSEAGRGSRVTLTLPLTLAVTDGMIVRVGRESYVLPIASIVECLAVSHQLIKNIPGSGEIVYVRGEPVKLVRLAQVFDVSSAVLGPQLLVIVVEIDDGQAIALAVDEIVDQQQVVMKSIRDNFDHVAGIAGATILGNGSVALFLDVAAIAGLSVTRSPRRGSAHALPAHPGRQVA